MGLFKSKKEAIMDLPKLNMLLWPPKFPESDLYGIKPFKPKTNFKPIEELEAESKETIIESKPLFVRIEKYHEAMNELNKVKEKLREAEKVLGGLIEIKKEEDNELQMWHDDIMELKNKVNRIDNILFEMKT